MSITLEEILGGPPVGRPKRKTIAQHKIDGTYRSDRHGWEDISYELPPCSLRPDTPHFQVDTPIDLEDLIEETWGMEINEALEYVPEDLHERCARQWVWDASDELAIRNGCRFSLRRAMHMMFTLRDNLQHWEGNWAGEPFIPRTWQLECWARVFGWVRPDNRWSWVRRFTKAAIWIPKKSGKSPGNAAVGLYLWRWDGVWTNEGIKKEAGQHVWSIAATGTQARDLVHKHAVNMATSSGGLEQEFDRKVCQLNMTDQTLTHHPSKSTYRILAGDNFHKLKSREGLNGCVICDEAHVVSQEVVDVTTDMGASRDQPLWSQVSTFGNEPGYGKNDLDEGRDIASGKVEDDAFFFRSYNAPADATDMDCTKEETWKRANPNYGYTVNPRQLAQSCQRAQADPHKFAGFKQRRLNIWQRASNPMLNMQKWTAAVASDITWEAMKGVGGGAGLDLAASEDWAAFVAVWQVEGELYCWPKLWTSTGWIDENGRHAPFQDWWNAGYLDVHDGGAVDFDIIENEIIEIMRHTKARQLGYDKMFAMQMAQSLQKRLALADIWRFSQSVEAYARGTAELKSRLKNGTFHHPGNLALDWMAEHVQSEVRGNYEKPVKDHKSPWKKVDGIQALIMGVDVRNHEPKTTKPWIFVG